MGDAGGESPAGSPQSSREVMALVSAGDAGKGAVSDDAPGNNKSGSRPRAPPRAADPDAIDAFIMVVRIEGIELIDELERRRRGLDRRRISSSKKHAWRRR